MIGCEFCRKQEEAESHFHAGMTAYEQMCEHLLMLLPVEESVKTMVQTQVLDTAQSMFEAFFRN